VPATCPYPEPTRSSPYPHILLPEDPSYVSVSYIFLLKTLKNNKR
jgi:hypothetical protein